MNNDLSAAIDFVSSKATDPFQRYIITNEILRQSPSDGEAEALYQSKWYRQLADEQFDNGSWGRFHSMDARIKDRLKFVSTEGALRRARDLGLSRSDPMMQKSLALMQRYLRKEEQWPDYTEKHHDNGKSFMVAFPFLIAANLSLFDPQNELLHEKREICLNMLAKAFKSGSFDEQIWEQDNRDYSGCCLRAWMVYPLWLLQGADELSADLERQYLNYIWHRAEGIYYISKNAPAVKYHLEDKGFTTWLLALEALSGFSLFAEFMADDVFEHLLGEVNRLMAGAVKLPPAHAITGHYAESWRNRGVRECDLIIRILRLLVRC